MQGLAHVQLFSSRSGRGDITGRGVPDRPVEGGVEGVACPVRWIGVSPPGVRVALANFIDLPGKRNTAENKQYEGSRYI